MKYNFKQTSMDTNEGPVSYQNVDEKLVLYFIYRSNLHSLHLIYLKDGPIHEVFMRLDWSRGFFRKLVEKNVCRIFYRQGNMLPKPQDHEAVRLFG
jgi:hypothetical protein